MARYGKGTSHRLRGINGYLISHFMPNLVVLLNAELSPEVCSDIDIVSLCKRAPYLKTKYTILFKTERFDSPKDSFHTLIERSRP